MSGFNLPPGVSVTDLPGNHPADMHAERYFEDHADDIGEYETFLRGRYGSVVDGASQKFLAMMLEEGFALEAFEDWLIERGREDYYDESEYDHD